MDSLLKGISLLAIVLYFAAIIYIGMAGLNAASATKIPAVITTFVTTTAGALATFIGMVLGFRQANQKSAQAITNVTRINWFQVIAAWSYVASLVLALVFWAASGFSDATPSVLQNMAQSILGLAAGALAVVLKTQ